MLAPRYFFTVFLLAFLAACSHRPQVSSEEAARNAALEEQRRFEQLQDVGVAAMHDGDFAAARAAWLEALGLRPADARLLSNLGLAELELGLIDEALVHTGRAVQLDGNSAAIAVNYGLALDADGHSAQAVGEFRRALDLEDDFEPAFLALGNRALARGEMREAERLFKDAVEKRPDSAGAYAGWAVVAARRGEWKTAAVRMMEAVRLDSRDTIILAAAGALQYRAGATDAATRLLDRALEIDPALPDALVLRAELAWLAGDYARAQNLYENALAVDAPGVDRAGSSLRRGELAFLLDQPGMAREALEDSLRQRGQPDLWRGKAYAMLGVMALQRRNWHEALEAFEKAEAWLGETALVHAGLGRARHGLALRYEREQRAEWFEAAERHYRASLDREENPRMRIQLGSLYAQWADLVDPSFRRGKLHQARVQYREALRVDDSLSEAHLRLALLFAQLEQPDAARASFESALARDGANSRAAFLYANFLRREAERTGDASTMRYAHRQYAEAMRLDPRFVGAQAGWFLTRGASAAATAPASATDSVAAAQVPVQSREGFGGAPGPEGALPGDEIPLNEYGDPLTDAIPPELEDLIPFLGPMPEEEWPGESLDEPGASPDVIPIKEGDMEPIYSIKATSPGTKKPAVYEP